MWVYTQTSGAMQDKTGHSVAVGYSGHGAGKNNPEMQCIHAVGPCPRGIYTLKEPVNTPTHGPVVIRLEPDPQNDMCGRDGLLCHGDSSEHPGEASLGCIIMPRVVRQQMWDSGDHLLEVVR